MKTVKPAVLSIRLSDKAKLDLLRRSESSNLSLSNYVRQCLEMPVKNSKKVA